ncbi:MAG TPA: hypothetical protein V6C91_05200 [Coleofasciculaceae cyanobacterium]
MSTYADSMKKGIVSPDLVSPVASIISECLLPNPGKATTAGDETKDFVGVAATSVIRLS